VKYDNDKFAPDYVTHEVFFRELHIFHAKLVSHISEIDFTNFANRLQELRTFVSGYPSYFRVEVKDNIKKEINNVEGEIFDEEFMNINFEIMKRGIDSLHKSEYIFWKTKSSKLISKINDIFEQINTELPRFKMMPRSEVVQNNLSEEEEDPEKKRELQALEEIGIL
jgi:Txe/YoeB family toxin of Txe-Axe toxin-antitoxin module